MTRPKSTRRLASRLIEWVFPRILYALGELVLCLREPGNYAPSATMRAVTGKSHVTEYFKAVARLASSFDTSKLDLIAERLVEVRDRGRLFVLGVGGGAGHSSHAVNDFRKLCGIEAYAPTDNVSELTARTNDEGWDTTFANWLSVSRLRSSDALFVFSVGGGSREHGVSVNIVNALECGKSAGCQIYGVVGAPGGALSKLADVAVLVDAPPELRTPLVESFQAVVWHALVSHPTLALRAGHWETVLSTPTTV